MSNETPSIRLRSDGQLGVDFDSPKTLTSFLVFVKILGNPSTRHFVPILENEGIIPKNDKDFQTLLGRMGIMAGDIPNTMRSYFLTTFQRRLLMQMSKWAHLPNETKKDFILYLRTLYISELFDKSGTRLPAKLIEKIIIPILENEGIIPESMDFVDILAKNWSQSNYNLYLEIERLIDEFLNQPINSRQAAAILNIKIWQVRTIARRHDWLFKKNPQGHWIFTRHTIMNFA